MKNALTTLGPLKRSGIAALRHLGNSRRPLDTHTRQRSTDLLPFSGLRVERRAAERGNTSLRKRCPPARYHGITPSSSFTQERYTDVTATRHDATRRTLVILFILSCCSLLSSLCSLLVFAHRTQCALSPLSCRRRRRHRRLSSLSVLSPVTLSAVA